MRCKVLSTNYMRKVLFLLFLLSSALCVSAQNVTGRVVDCEDSPIEGANVILMHTDSTYINVVMSDSCGLFSFENRVDSFRLVLQHIAYNNRELFCTSPFVGDVVMEASGISLDDIVVTGERPLVRIEEERLAYDLGQLTHDKVVNNTYEALTKLPGISEKEEKLTLVGASSLTVIINGKPSTMTAEQLTALLKSTPVERVDKVEVMYSAPPQYHVRGAALNIVLKKDTQYSFQGELGGDYVNRFNDNGGVHIFLRAATPKYAFDAMYNISRTSEVQDLDMVSRHTFRGVLHNISQFEKMRGNLWYHNARASFEYNFNDRNVFSIAYNYQTKTDAKSNSTSVGNYQESDLFKTVGKNYMHNFSLRTFTGIGLSFGVDYTIYESNTAQQMNVDYINDNQRLLMSQKTGQDVRALHAYADQKHSFAGGWTLGYGASYRTSESKDYQIYTAESTLAGNDVNSSLSEHTSEAYLSFGRQSPLGLSFSLSATAEYYKINQRKRWTLYPQASLTYMRNPDHIFQSTLNVDKMYPSYWQMQAAVSYIDGYSELHNTPELEPSKTYMLNMNYIYKQKYVFVLFCNYVDKFFGQTMYQSNERLALIYQTLNWDYYAQSGVVAVVPYNPVSWLNSRATLVGSYVMQRCDNFFDIGFKDNDWVAHLALDNSFKVNDNVALELNGWVQSPVTQGTFSVKTMCSLSAGVKWNFAGGKGTFSCFYNDIFNSTLGEMVMDYKGQNLMLKNNLYTRKFTLSLVYRFGGYKKKEGGDVDVSRFGH